jgi:hypothetical protein
VILHSSSFVILSFHFISIIRLKHFFTNIWRLLVILLVIFQVSQAYNNTDLTVVLNIRISTPFDMLWFLHRGYSWTNTPFAFLILLATSSSVPPFSDTTLPRYTEDPTSSVSVSSNLNFCTLDVLTLSPFVLFMSMSICFVRFVFLFILGWFCCFWGVYFIISDLIYFVDWNTECPKKIVPFVYFFPR